MHLVPAPPRPDLGPLLARMAMLQDAQGSTVLHVTAARHGEGVTTVARELAAAAARASWRSVALLDAHGAEGGLLEAFASTGEAALRRGRVGGMAVGLGGLGGLGGQGAPRMEGVRALFGQLRAQWTLVVVDAPPVLDDRERAVLAAAADAVMLVVAAERTLSADAMAARDALRQMGASVLGAVLNRRGRRLPRLLERMTA